MQKVGGYECPCADVADRDSAEFASVVYGYLCVWDLIFVFDYKHNCIYFTRSYGEKLIYLKSLLHASEFISCRASCVTFSSELQNESACPKIHLWLLCQIVYFTSWCKVQILVFPCLTFCVWLFQLTGKAFLHFFCDISLQHPWHRSEYLLTCKQASDYETYRFISELSSVVNRSELWAVGANRPALLRAHNPRNK